MKYGIEVSPLCFLLEPPQRLGIKVSHVPEHCQPRTPVTALRPCRKQEQVTPAMGAAYMVDCNGDNSQNRFADCYIRMVDLHDLLVQ